MKDSKKLREERIRAHTLLDCTVTKDNLYGKRSRSKVIVSDHIVEVYIYERPIRHDFFIDKKHRKKKKKSNNPRTQEYMSRSAIKARNTIRRLALTNFDNNSKFITLTFRDTDKFDITNFDECNKEFKKFIQRLKFKFGHLPYIAVPEFQKRGAIHYHLLLKSPYINHNILSQIWRHGFIKINKVEHVDNIGAYISKYMSKEHHDSRFKGKKRYFTSKGLNRSKVYYGADAIRIHFAINHKRTQPVFSSRYTSELNGKVRYFEYNLKRKDGNRKS